MAGDSPQSALGGGRLQDFSCLPILLAWGCHLWGRAGPQSPPRLAPAPSSPTRLTQRVRPCPAPPEYRNTAPPGTQKHTPQCPHFQSKDCHAAPTICRGDATPERCAPYREEDHLCPISHHVRGAGLSPQLHPALGSETYFSLHKAWGFGAGGAQARAPQNTPLPFPHPKLTSMPSLPGFPGDPWGPGGPRGPTF